MCVQVQIQLENYYRGFISFFSFLSYLSFFLLSLRNKKKIEKKCVAITRMPILLFKGQSCWKNSRVWLKKNFHYSNKLSFLFSFFSLFFLLVSQIILDIVRSITYVYHMWKLVWNRSRQRESVKVRSRLPVRTLCAHLIYVESTNFRQRKKEKSFNTEKRRKKGKRTKHQSGKDTPMGT